MNCKVIFAFVFLVIAVLLGVFIYQFRSYVGPNGYGFATHSEEVANGTDLTGKVALVTGAASGIGLETARILALRGAHVFVLARSPTKSQQAVDEILAQLPSSPPKPYKLTPFSCDLASLSSIRQSVEEFKLLNVPLHILVANAATIPNTRRETEDGFESQMGVNHLAHFYLINLLIDKLIESQPSRVIVVSSDAYKRSSTSFLNDTELGQNEEYSSFDNYSKTKLANIIHARELSERFSSKGVTAYSLHPGLIFTNILQDSSITKYLVRLLTPFTKDVSQGTSTTIYVALKAPTSQSGSYFSNCNLIELDEPYSELVNDQEVRKRLWDYSERLIQEKLNKDLL